MPWLSWFLPRSQAARPRTAVRPTRVRLGVESLEDRRLLTAGLPMPDHIVVVVEENHSFSEILGNSLAPYLNSLVNGGHAALFTQSFAVTHPSQPNYLDLFAGANQGVTTDATPTGTPFGTANLGAELGASGRNFVGYAEGLPSVGYTGASSGAYVRKHAPWVNWQGTGTNRLPTSTNQPFSNFPRDFTKLPTVSFVTPNLNDDMHDGSIAAGDTWLKNRISGYMSWARLHNSMLIVTFDEDDHSQSNQIFTLFVGPMVKKGQYAEHINHFNVLRTIEDMYNLPRAGASATATPITNVWTVSTMTAQNV